MASPVRVRPPQLVPHDPPRSARTDGRARRADGARQPHDGWTFVLIPPGTGARPRTLQISVRRLRAIVVAGFTAAGTSVVVMALLGLVLSAAPRLESESRGVQLGVLAIAPAAPMSTDALPIVTPPFATTAPIAEAPAAEAPAPAAAAPSTPARRTAPVLRPRRSAEERALPFAAGPRVAASADDGASVRDHAAGTGEHSVIGSLPVIGRITSNFSRARRHPLLGVVRRHKGVDIAAPSGTRITASAAGRVAFAGRRVGFGLVVEIDHGGGVLTRYAHCRSINVRVGEEVTAGQTVAAVGSTGLATGPHLHYEILVGGRSVDPMRNSLARLLPRSEAARGAAAPALAVPPAAAMPLTPDPMAPLDTVRDLPKDTMTTRR